MILVTFNGYLHKYEYMNGSHKKLAYIYLTEMAYGMGADSTPITKDALLQIIKDFDKSDVGTRPISFTSVTNPVYRKTGFPYKALYKVGQTAGMLGTDYSGNVNRQREREGKPADFAAQQSSTIKEWISPSIGITHKGNVVIKYRPLAPSPSFWVVQNNDGTFVEVSKEEALKYITPTAGAPNQGVEKEISYRTYGIDKLVAVNFLKNEYMVSDADPTRLEVFSLVKDKVKS